MWEKFEVDEQAVDCNLDRVDQVQYNLLYRICEIESSTRFKTPDGKMIFAQSEGHNAWLWISNDVSEDERRIRLHELIDCLDGMDLLGITGAPQTIELFTQVYFETRGIGYLPHMDMESYYCPEVKQPVDIGGTIQPANEQHIEIVAEFMAGFSEAAYGKPVDPVSQIAGAESMVKSGSLFLWMVDNSPVSMANIAHRSACYARINAVYTPTSMRKKGYASAIVAGLCTMLVKEHLVPMLYADLKNPHSNKVYQNIGFVKNGKIADVKFK
ncbi:GNAT family N-acetyltransferase [Cohnella sp. WQ 127256]|uniref:GNAT family N-acetyltransferase n=1 Tax=Cohnella sp. WQ 127256 TaxID=2938790 RepID=UPI0021178DAF|nr:GNAT family N-acetyltransferase [Cohnella sp. WQ 127256]